ncbi:hypothetical protein [Piscirickettsia litoralis]|uniref:Uncharacterized protein n=1 Tax=Piscirickettsia litoralis TaxID=1891921 RepID=A0ABX2ZZI5_9GAMM|nr:hypothetical protein [Piscirickettsia litoralis]ODN41643.1 hypothetical protein BGC07_16245 [Piscirickettsia litoralis]
MTFNPADFKELQSSLYESKSKLPDFSDALEKSKQKLGESISLPQEVQPKKVFATPLEACQYHVAQVKDAIAMDKNAIFLSADDLKGKTQSEILNCANESQQKLIDYHKIENRFPQVDHLQQLKSSLINLKDKHQVPGDMNNMAFDQLQASVNGMTQALSMAQGNTQNIYSKAMSSESAISALSSARGVNLPIGLTPALSQFDTIASAPSLQERAGLYFGDSGSNANDLRSSGSTAVPQNGDDFSGKTELEKSVALFLGDSGSVANGLRSSGLAAVPQNGDDFSGKTELAKKYGIISR